MAQFSEDNKTEKPKRKRGRPSKKDLEQRAAAADDNKSKETPKQAQKSAAFSGEEASSLFDQEHEMFLSEKVSQF